MDMTSDESKVGSSIPGSEGDILGSSDFELVPPYQIRRISPSLVTSGEGSPEWCVTVAGYAIICNRCSYNATAATGKGGNLNHTRVAPLCLVNYTATPATLAVSPPVTDYSHPPFRV